MFKGMLMERKTVAATIAIAGSFLTLAFFTNRYFSDGSALPQPTVDINEQWAPVSNGLPVRATHPSVEPAQSESNAHFSDELASSTAISSMQKSGNQDMLNGLSSEMQAMYSQQQEQDLEYQQKMMQEIESPSESRRLPEEEQRLLSVAIAHLPGASLETSDAANVAWQPVEEEFTWPDDEQFYDAQVYQACADAMCKLQFQGLGNEASRDSAIEKLISSNKIPQGSLVVPDENDLGSFVVIYPKKQG